MRISLGSLNFLEKAQIPRKYSLIQANFLYREIKIPWEKNSFTKPSLKGFFSYYIPIPQS